MKNDNNIRVTEQTSLYNNLENKSVDEVIKEINTEDKKVAVAIEEQLPALSRLISALEYQLKAGGRMFYVGCGTGGRLAVVDIIELPNTYGIEKGMINVILGGGLERFVEAPEEKEDEPEEGWNTLVRENISPKDFVVGISASGNTPFVLGAMKKCKEKGIPCGSIVNNPNSPISDFSDYPVEIVMGPEYVTGSTRMKCGTSQKMVLDMISTTLLIRMGRVEDNKMVNVRLINDKVIDRSVRMILNLTSINDYQKAKEILFKYGNVKNSVEYIENILKETR
jgi:N-acetylmuramic acid 6-phosphate etherase